MNTALLRKNIVRVDYPFFDISARDDVNLNALVNRLSLSIITQNVTGPGKGHRCWRVFLRTLRDVFGYLNNEDLSE